MKAEKKGQGKGTADLSQHPWERSVLEKNY